MIDILRPNIFDRSKLQCGVTSINKRMFPRTGLSLAPAEILSDDDFNTHLQLFAHTRGVEADNIKFNKQIHSDIIHIVDYNYETREGDALITNEAGLMIYIKIADCAAILIYDPVNNVIAAVHSGWRGTQKNISAKTIKLMKKEFSSDAKDLLCYISPCASKKNYEVGREFLELFPDTTTKKGKNKYYFDNRAEIKSQLLNAGIEDSNIEVSDICTIEDENYHSYRRDGAASGRMAAFIMIKTKVKS